MLAQAKDNRTLKANLLLASSTALVAGVINVAGVIAFLAFTTNITGHVALLARKVSAKDIEEVITVFIWLLMFFIGAFVSHFLVRSFERRSLYLAHAMPIIAEMVILLFVAIYGNHFFTGSDTERDVIIGAMLFSMGLQNSLVSTISGGLIKSSHLTGLFTDVGADIAEWLHPRTGKTEMVKNRIVVRLTVLLFYFLGAVAGGFFFEVINFKLFYFVPVVLLGILLYDLWDVGFNNLGSNFAPDTQSK
ncbi:YoaK family protein [Mucilaginibacter sp. AW1-3]